MARVCLCAVHRLQVHGGCLLGTVGAWKRGKTKLITLSVSVRARVRVGAVFSFESVPCLPNCLTCRAHARAVMIGVVRYRRGKRWAAAVAVLGVVLVRKDGASVVPIEWRADILLCGRGEEGGRCLMGKAGMRPPTRGLRRRHFFPFTGTRCLPRLPCHCHLPSASFSTPSLLWHSPDCCCAWPA